MQEGFDRCPQDLQSGDLNSVAVLRSEQADKIVRPVHNYSKEVGDVTAEHAHVESFRLGKRSEGSTEEGFTAIDLSQANLGGDMHRGSNSADTGKLRCGCSERNCQDNQQVGGQCRPVSTRVNKEGRFDPCPVRCFNGTANNRTNAAIIADESQSIDLHKCVPSCS
jgi:hypothetical protein